MTRHTLFEDVGRQGLVDAGPLVADFDDDAALGGAGVRPHARRSVAVSQGVFDEGGQDLPEFAGVGQDRALGLVEEDEGAPGEGELVLPFLAGGVEDFEDVDRLGPSAAFTFGDVQEFGMRSTCSRQVRASARTSSSEEMYSISSRRIDRAVSGVRS